MEIRKLYRVVHSDGVVTVTPQKPSDGEYSETYRLIADDGMILTDGENTYCCIDTDFPQNYIEETDVSYVEVES